MSEYQIMRWDVITAGNSNNKVPMIYIKPDITFLEFARVNNFAVMCEINGTGTQYDGKQIPGVIDKSCFVPNYRPNFCEQTGWYVITLWSNWYGYPNVGKEGVVKFFGLEKPLKTGGYQHSGPDDKLYPLVKKNSIPVKSNKKGGMNKNMLIILSVIGIIFLLIILVILFSKKM